jgi:hypothetical protein
MHGLDWVIEVNILTSNIPVRFFVSIWAAPDKAFGDNPTHRPASVHPNEFRDFAKSDRTGISCRVFVI